MLIYYTLVHIVVSVSYHCLSPHRSLNRIQYLGKSYSCDQCAPKFYLSKFNSHSALLIFQTSMHVHVFISDCDSNFTKFMIGMPHDRPLIGRVLAASI